jgi:hypothetical protein
MMPRLTGSVIVCGVNRVTATKVFFQTIASPIKARLNPSNSIIKFLLVTLHLTHFRWLGLGHLTLA